MDSENILSITLGSKEYYFLYENNKIWYVPEGKKQNESYKANKSGASAIIEVPPIWIITRKNGAPLFAIKASPNDQEKFNILSAKKLYDSAIQWFEPLADNYRELIWIHPQSSVSDAPQYVAYKHFSWQDIIDFSLKDRFSFSYFKYFPGDWKYVKRGADQYLLVMIDNFPYWADAIGQIPFAVDTMRLYIKKINGDYDSAIRKTIEVGMNHGKGELYEEPDKTNAYDNYMILRGCLWTRDNFYCAMQFTGNSKRLIRVAHHQKTNKHLTSGITEDERNKYAQWNY